MATRSAPEVHARASQSPSGTSRQPRFGAIDTKPSLRRTTPTTATPTPSSGSSAGRRARSVSASSARSAEIAATEAWPLGRSIRVSSSDLAAQSDHGRRERIDGDLEGQHDAARRVEADDGRRSAGRAVRSGALLGDEVGRGQLTDEAADRAARQTGPRHELGPRRRAAAMQLPDDRAQVRPAHRLAALADRVEARDHGFVFLSLKWLCHTGPPVHPVSRDAAEPTMTDLRWGILSTADIARRKVIPGIQKASRCDVVAIASRDSAHAREVAAELGIPTAHGSYEALLADPNVDAVYIPLPNHLHAEWTIAAARAGKHVLCEKPLALTAAEAEQMVERLRRTRASTSWRPSCTATTRHGWRPSELVEFRPDRPAAGGPELVLVLQRRPGQHPQPGRGRRRRPVRHRLLLDQPLADAVRRGADPGQRRGRPRARDRRGRPDQRDPRVRRRDRDVHLLDPGRARPAGPHLRDEGAGLHRDPVQHPARSADPDRRHGRRRPAGCAGRETITFDTADPYTVEAERFAASILDGLPTPTPPEDAVANMRVIDRIFAAGSIESARAAAGPS